MGILDSKSRVMDVVITTEGRRQMSAGTFDVKYATFSDASVFYEADAENGHVDPTGRLYFEAVNLPQDQIIFEANDEGSITLQKPVAFKIDNTSNKLTPFTSSSVVLKEGKLFFSDKYYGRSFRVNQVPSLIDDGLRITYNDVSGNVGHLVIDYSRKAGSISSSLSERISYIGMKGINYENFLSSISSSLVTLNDAAGPYVHFSQSKNYFLLDYGQERFGTVLKFFSGSAATVKNPDTGNDEKSISLFPGTTAGHIFTGELTSNHFASQMSNILTSSIDNFNKLHILSTVDGVFDDDIFELSKNSSNLSILTNKEITLSSDSHDAFFSDARFRRIENYAYLPPVVRQQKNSDKKTFDLLGDYPSFGDNEKPLTLDEAGEFVTKYLSEKSRDFSNFTITRTSRNNNIIIQFFEFSKTGATKLDSLDFGEVVMNGIKKRVIFVGKVREDSVGLPKFFCLFTLITKPKEI